MAAPHLSRLSDRDLLSRLNELARCERLTTIEILHHLNEIERRRLHTTQGFSSMFDYCTRSLRYSASAASRRIRSARCLRRYPNANRLLEKREVSLSTLALVSHVLTDDNSAALLKRVRGKSQREVESIVAEYRAPLQLRDRVRPVRVRVARPAASTRGENRTSVSDYCRSGSDSGKATVTIEVAAAPAENQQRLPQTTIEKKLWIQFLASEAFMRKYEEVRALLGNRVAADATFEDIFGIIMEEFVERHSPVRRTERRKAHEAREAREARPATGDKVRESRPATDTSRRVPAHIRDDVFKRDRGRCTFVGPDGARCGARRYLQIDHIRPFSRGGGHDPSNLRLLCSAHNRSEAVRILGAPTMKRFRRRE